MILGCGMQATVGVGIIGDGTDGVLVLDGIIGAGVILAGEVPVLEVGVLVLDMVGTILILSLFGITVLVIMEIILPLTEVEEVFLIELMLMLGAIDYQIKEVI